MIDITGVDLVRFIKEVYALSKPQGLGMLHYQPGELSDTEAQEIIDRERPQSRIAASMDYVRGRACKMTVFRAPNGELTIGNNWFDHSPRDLDELLRCIGKEPAERSSDPTRGRRDE